MALANGESRHLTFKLARMSARRPKTVLAAWGVAFLVSLFLSQAVLPGVLTTEQNFTVRPEAFQALDLLEESGLQGPVRSRELIIVRSESQTVESPAFQRFVTDLHGRIAALGPDVVELTATYYMTGDESMVSTDRKATLIPVVLAGELADGTKKIHDVNRIIDEVSGGSFEVLITGDATLGASFQETAETDLIKGETFGVGVALVILLLVFGTVVSAVIPIILAVASIVVALGMTAIVGQAFELSFFVTNMITMMGLAVGIDYSLFVVSRFREELHHGCSKVEAVEIASDTASRAVFFSGITVVFALMGLLLVPLTVFRSLGTGAILVVIVAVLGALTLLPAVLALFGHRVDAWRLRLWRRRPSSTESGRFWDWVTRRVMARPVLSILVAGGALVAAVVPYFDINTGAAGISSLPDKVEAKQAFLVLQEEFAERAGTTAQVVLSGNLDAPGVEAGVAALRERVAQDDAFLGMTGLRRSESGRVGVVDIQVEGDPVGTGAVDAVRRLRNDYVPAAFGRSGVDVLVGGNTAFNIDFFGLVSEYSPRVFAFVLSLSFLLLLVVFRSIVIPLKAIALNLLSVGASYGLVVLVTQKGFGIDLFGFQQAEVVEAWIPLFLFSVLFGLSMDYHVFLLSRIRESYDQTKDNAGSVAFGLRSTAGLITGAALIMVAVFSGFAAGDLVMFQQMGFGLAVAVLLDATIVRSVLVPASMRLLGSANWWFPRSLRWLPHVGIEGPTERERAAVQVAGGSE